MEEKNVNEVKKEETKKAKNKSASLKDIAIVLGIVFVLSLAASVCLKMFVFDKQEIIEEDNTYNVQKEHTKYSEYPIEGPLFDENGNETSPKWIYPEFVKTLEVDVHTEMNKELIYEGDMGDFTEAGFVRHEDNDYCIYILVCDNENVSKLPLLETGKLKTPDGEELGLTTYLGPYLFINGSENVETLDLSAYDLSNVACLQLYGFNNLKNLNLGNFIPQIVKDGYIFDSMYKGDTDEIIPEAQELFVGIEDKAVQGIENINVCNLDVAKWIKKEALNATMTVNDKPIIGNLDYIVQYVKNGD